MSDVKLTVGVNEELSFRDFDSSIKRIINKVNNQNYKIKIDLSDESLKDFRNQINEIAKSIKNIGLAANAANGFGNIKSTLKDISGDYDKIIAKAEKAKSSFSSKRFKGYSQISAKQSEYEAAHFKAMENLSNGVASQTEIANVAKLRNELNKLVESYLAVNKASGKSKSSSGSMTDNQKTSALTSIDAEIARLESKKVKYSAAKYGESSKYYAVYDKEIENLKTLRTQVEGSTKSQNSFNKALRDSKNATKEASDNIAKLGKNHESLGDRFKGFAKHFSNWVSTSRAYRFIEQTARKMLSSVVEIDAAMTELKKVTDETEETYNTFLDRAADRAKKLGATLKDTISASADMARLGFDLDDASTLADTALVYKNVGDGISDINEASSSIISTMQAFGVEAENSMQIVDKFNTAGNNFAISSGGVGDALLNSASALAAAGNSLDESIAMITAANTVVQDPQKVGTSMKTISMYLRAAKTDAEAAGESTDGMADSVSKLRAEILQLTGGKVDIQIDENNFKSTYQIMKDLSEVWSGLSDISQANILERIGGKRNANITAALLENFELVDKVIDKTSDSTGSALAENEKYLDSVNGKIAQFKASFEELSTEVLDSDILKLVIDAGSVGLETISNIVGGLKGVAGALTDLGIGLEYIIPLLGLKFFGVFDGIADYATDKLQDIGVVLEKLYNDSGRSIGGILKKSGSGIKDFFKSGLGKASIAIATISLLVTAFNNLTERTEKAKTKLEETRTELSDTQSNLESLNKELSDTRIKMKELLSMESLTYVEYEELNKLKLSNKELEKEIDFLKTKEKLLKNQEIIDFNKVAKNELNSFWESFEGLSFWDFLSGNINYGDTQADQVKKQIEDYFHNLKAYGYRQSDYTNLSSKYANKTTERDQKAYQKEAEQLEKDMSNINDSINNSKAYLNERLISYQSAILGVEYGVNEATDKYLDQYNDLIDSIGIALGYDDAEENAFNRLINETFDDATDRFEDLGKDGKVTAKEIEDNIGSGKPLEGFIDKLIELGYISDKQRGSLSKVARAFNSLGEEARDAGDEVEDAFQRWENAQDAVESGAKFDSFKKAMELVYDTVSDKSSELYAKIGNENYKAAIELIIPEWKNIDSSDMSAVKKYQKEIKKFFTFDENGEYKGLNVKEFSKKALEAGLVDYDKVTKTYKIKGKQTLESFAEGMGLSVPAIKAIIGEINEYGGDIQLYEYNKDIVSLAQEAKNAAASLEESFSDLDIELDLTTIEDPIAYIDQKIVELNKKRIAPNVDTTSFNNYTKIMEYYIRQKQLLEKPAILMLDTTQIEDPAALAAINKLIKFTNIKREIEVQATLGHDTSTLEKDLAKLAEDIQKSYKDGGGIAALGFIFDEKSKKGLIGQINDFINGLSKDKLEGLNIGITSESFEPAMDAIETIATKINEVFSSKRVLTFDWQKEDGVWKLKINTEEVEKAREETEETNENLEEISEGAEVDLKETSFFKKTFEHIKETLSTLLAIKNGSWTATVKIKEENSNTSDNTPKVTPITSTGNSILDDKLKPTINKKFGEVNGTAHANGNWGFEGGEALVGELGQEIVVDPKTSSWYTVGDHGAEFVDIPQNAIIFNHKQTESLLKNGYVTGRGHALAGGTALSLNGSWGEVPTGDINTQGKKSKDSSSQIIDYIEILLSRLSRSLENFAKVTDDTSKSFKERNKALEKQIDKTDSLITANQNAADAYLKKANSISLSSGIKEKVRNGSYDITKYDSDTAEKINQYKEYYEKYLEAKDEINNQKSNKAALTMEQFDLIQSKYDSKYGYQDSRLDYQEALNEKYELLGQGGSLAAQDNSIEIYQNRVKLLKEEQDEYNKLLNSGAIKKNTEDWYKLKEAIASNKAEILETENTIEELNKKKIEIKFDRFEKTREDYENKLSVDDNKVDYWEAVNDKAVAEGHGGSLTAQKEILAIHENRLSILKEEKSELEAQLKKIPKETDEWYKAKNSVQELNQEIVNTNTELIETKKNIDAINFERFQNVSVDYANKNIGIEDSIKRWEDVNTKMELLGDHGSVHAQDKMIEWNEAYIESLRNELADMKDKWDKIDKDSQEYIDAEKAIREKQDQIRDAENQQLQYANNKRDILFSQYQDLQAEYDNKLGDIDHALSKVNHDIAMAESKGYKVSKSFYEDQKKLEQDRLNTIKEQYQEMKKHFEDAVSTGEIKEGSLEWYEYQKSLYAVEQSANDAELAIENLNQSIKDVDWENFKYLRDTIDELNDEADFYLELMSDEDMFDDKGNITEYGMASIGLRGQKYNTYMEEAAANSKKLKEIEEELAKDPANQKLIDQKKELTDAIYDNILAAKDQKQAMIDLVEDGINYELDALRDLIDEYKDALDKTKDLHDYEKKVNESTSEISSIKKQLSAYSGDDSQEAKLKIQKLQENLKKAEEELEETEYDRYISDQKELLDDFYDEYETNLNARLDDIDMVISELITSVNQNSGAINETLNGLANEFGIELSEDMKNIWGDSKLGDILQHYIGENSDITRGQTTIVSVLGDIADKVDLIINASKNNSSSSVGSSSSLVGSTSYEKVRLDNAAVYANKGDSNPKYGSINSDYSFGVGNGTVPLYIKEIDGDWIGLSLTDNPNDPPIHWIKASDGNFRKYKNGGLVDYTGLAWVDGTKSNPEYMLNATDTENLMKLTDDLRKLYNGNITGSEIAQNASDIMRIIGLSSGVLTDINKTIGSAGNSIGDINITIPIERVQDYNDFVTQLKDDPKFDKLVKSLSLDLLDGKSRLAKNRINWNK